MTVLFKYKLDVGYVIQSHKQYILSVVPKYMNNCMAKHLTKGSLSDYMFMLFVRWRGLDPLIPANGTCCKINPSTDTGKVTGWITLAHFTYILNNNLTIYLLISVMMNNARRRIKTK